MLIRVSLYSVVSSLLLMGLVMLHQSDVMPQVEDDSIELSLAKRYF